MIKSVIVTGGTGVTGNALVKYLLNQGIQVTALVRSHSQRRFYLPEKNSLLTVVECGMEEYTGAEHIIPFRNYDVFFHLAWDGSTGRQKVENRNNYRLQNQNVAYSLDAVELCHRLECPVFLMTGSQAEYGRKKVPVTEDMEKCPENGYGMAKLCAEGMTRLMCRDYGIRHIWPVLFSIYGPCDATDSLVDVSVRELLVGKDIPYTPGEQQWDYLYSYDAARAMLLLAQKGESGESYLVANGKTRAVSEYIWDIYQEVAPEKTPRLGECSYAKNQVMYLGADITKLREATGFEPEYTFPRGIREVKNSILEETAKSR